MIQISENLVLKLLEENDAEQLFQLVDSYREVLRQSLPWVDANVKVSDSLSFIQSTKGKQWGICYKANLVGVIGLPHYSDNLHEVTVGYWLTPHLWGQGIMTNVITGLIEHLFSECTEKITVFIAEVNDRSLAIVRKLGFEIVDILKHGEELLGKRYDQLIYRLTKKEYLLQKI